MLVMKKNPTLPYYGIFLVMGNAGFYIISRTGLQAPGRQRH